MGSYEMLRQRQHINFTACSNYLLVSIASAARQLATFTPEKTPDQIQGLTFRPPSRSKLTTSGARRSAPQFRRRSRHSTGSGLSSCRTLPPLEKP